MSKVSTLNRISDILCSMHGALAEIEFTQADGFTFHEAALIGRMTQSIHSKLQRESNYVETLAKANNPLADARGFGNEVYTK